MDAREIYNILHEDSDSYDSLGDYMAHHYNVAENVVMGDAMAHAMAGGNSKVIA